MQEFGQKYLDLGFSIIPIGEISIKPDGGKSIVYPISWKKYQTERATPATVSSWHWDNLGIITGKLSGIVVIDTDFYKSTFDNELFKSFNIPVTPVQQTARGGHQYFFKHPGFEVKDAVDIGHVGSGIDVRGDGGMVIVPPTKTTYGEYTWLVDPFETPLADLPPKLLDFLKKNTPTGITKTVPQLVNLVEGQGRDSAMASLVGKFTRVLDPKKWIVEIPSLMAAVNNTYKPPLTQADLTRIYDSITKKELWRGQGNLDPKQFIPSFSFFELMTKEYPAPQFVLDPYFETNAVNMVSAPPNTWKSWLFFALAGSIASGDELFNHFKTEQHSVMIVNEEDSPRSIQDRFKLLDITNKDLPIYFHVAQGLKIDKAFVDNIVKEMKDNKIDVLLLDSLRSMHSAVENDSTEMQIVLDHLKEISRQNITVIFTHHHRKRHPLDKQQSADASRGSSAINAAISGHISLDEENRENGIFMIIHHLKSKVSSKLEPVEIKISKTDGTGIMVFDYQGTFKSSNMKIENAKEAIIKNLQEGGWMSVTDFIELEIAGDSIIRAALRDLKKSGIATTMTRAEARKQGVAIEGEGRANELVYSWCEGKNNELDKFANDLNTIDPNSIPI